MRVVIADDEEMARFMIRSQIGDVGAGLDCRIVAEAKNGEELLAAVRATRPDVVIADIRMPVLGGLEALRASKGERAETDWIMLTGFSDFQYAREALRGGACEYLLKPVLGEELRATLERAFCRFRARKAAARRAVAEGLALQRLLGDRSASLSADEELRLRLFLFDSVDSFAATAASDLVRSSLETAVGGLSTFPCGEGTLICVSAEEDEPIALEAILTSSSSPSVTITVVSDRVQGGRDLVGAFASLMELAPLRAVHGLGREYSRCELAGHDRGVGDFCRRLDEWAAALRRLDFDGAFRIVDEAERGDAVSTLSAAALHRLASFIGVRSGLAAASMERAPAHGGRASFSPASLLRAATERRRAEHDGSGDLVEATVAYVEANYMNNIGLAVIADRLGVSANYLSGVFHKRIGVRFSDYLVRYRISQARRRLVLSPREPIADLARAVGFPNARYFAKRFSHHVGVTPSEYRSVALKGGTFPDV